MIHPLSLFELLVWTFGDSGNNG